MAANYSSLQVRQALKNIGFSENEVKVLGFLFRKKKATAREISQYTAISFSTVQYILNNLVSRKIIRVSHIQEEDSFEICSEEKLMSWIDIQKSKNEKIYEDAKKDIHDFLDTIKESSWKPEISYFEGKEGVIEIYEDMLRTAEKTDKKIYSWLDIRKIYESLGDYLFEYIEKRIEKNITSHDIAPKNKMNLQHFEKNENRSIKFVENLPIDGEIRIYGDKVAVITFDKKKPVGFVFEGKIVTSLFKTIFQSHWEKS
ncbi:hypothetical protein K9M59_04285 [Candidatus Gracilibacteria bacterium]|nr:hypothetical protein [Candidatus Gracilibacteria bacterium]MCF7819539.1 hypothetical protein [Candidatus Gracilibacteria bacterium]